MTEPWAERFPAGAPQPRWAPDRPLAERITRRGRFAALDPTAPRPLPSVAKWVAFGGWATLLGGSLVLARRRQRQA